MTTRRRIRRSLVAVAIVALAGGASLVARTEQAGAVFASTTHLYKTPVNQTVGNPETINAHIGARINPTGTVEFFEGATSLGTAPVVNRVASFTQVFAAGTHTVSAVYTSDNANVSNSNSNNTVTFIVGDPSNTRSVLLYKSIPAMPVSTWTPTTHVIFTGNVGIAAGNINYGARTGTATFVLDGNLSTVTVTNSHVIVDVPGGLGPGAHYATFTYHGDIHYNPSTAGTRHITIVNP